MGQYVLNQPTGHVVTVETHEADSVATVTSLTITAPNGGAVTADDLRRIFYADLATMMDEQGVTLKPGGFPVPARKLSEFAEAYRLAEPRKRLQAVADKAGTTTNYAKKIVQTMRSRGLLEHSSKSAKAHGISPTL